MDYRLDAVARPRYGRNAPGNGRGQLKKRFDVADRHNIRRLTVGVIGYGQIGRRVAKGLSAAFGHRVIVNDLIEARQQTREHGFEVMSIDDLVQASDIVSIHTQAIHGEPPTLDRRRASG